MLDKPNRFWSRTTLKVWVFALLLALANLAGMYLYFRWTSPPPPFRPGGLDPPDVLQPPGPSTSVMGVYPKAAVVATGPPCAAIGRDMLSAGGTAVDAAIATLLCDGLFVMQAMGVGGGFLMTIYNKTEGKAYSLVARETAPAAATEHMFVQDPQLAKYGPLAVAVPGELKGYQEAHRRFGKLPWRELFLPTIKLCEEGFTVSPMLAKEFSLTEQHLRASPSAMEVLLNSTSERLPKEGELMKLPKLGETLRVIAESPNMADELYRGSLTKGFVKDIQDGGGIITEQDMNDYQVRWENPVTANLSGGLQLLSAPLPGSGLLVSFMLRLLDGFLQYADSDLRRSQLIIESFKHAYGRRSHLGDPHFMDPSLLNEVMFNLTDDATIRSLRSKISYNSTWQDPAFYGADYFRTRQDHGTNNVVVVAPDGSAVCVTSTINTLFGSTFVSESTGILLNNQMDDFSTPGAPNYWGVRPSEANLIAPGKRPMSSMSPTIVVDREGDVRLAVGAAGGTTITTQVTAVAVRNLWLGYNIKEALDKRRYHHQLMPMEVSYEYGITQDTLDAWHAIGHGESRRSGKDYPLGLVSAVARLGSRLTANCDWRRPGSVAGL